MRRLKCQFIFADAVLCLKHQHFYYHLTLYFQLCFMLQQVVYHYSSKNNISFLAYFRDCVYWYIDIGKVQQNHRLAYPSCLPSCSGFMVNELSAFLLNFLGLSTFWQEVALEQEVWRLNHPVPGFATAGIFFSAQPSIILLLLHIWQDFFGQITRMSKFSQ